MRKAVFGDESEFIRGKTQFLLMSAVDVPAFVTF